MKEVKCSKCNKPRQFDENNNPKEDPCLGYLPGVKSACCGHGSSDGGYMIFDNETTIHFIPKFIRRKGLEEPVMFPDLYNRNLIKDVFNTIKNVKEHGEDSYNDILSEEELNILRKINLEDLTKEELDEVISRFDDS